MTRRISETNRADRHRTPSTGRSGSPAWRIAVFVALVVGSLLALPSGAGAQGSASVSAAGGRVTVDVTGVPGHQVRVELQDDSIAATALISATGQAQMVFDLPSGDYELEVITFNPTGVPNSVGTYPVSVAGPPPPAPTVEVTAGSPADNRTIVRLAGPPDTNFGVEIIREGETLARESGTTDANGAGRAVLLLESGPWGYFVTLTNGSGASTPALGEFAVDIGTPSPPVLELLTPPGQNPATVGVTGPAGGSIDVTATQGDRRVTASSDLSQDGAAQVELDLPESGQWEVSAIATDLADQRSDPGELAGGVEAVGDGPPLELERISAGSGEFGFRVTTSVGSLVEVRGDDEALRFEFTAETEETEFTPSVSEGEHTIEVTASDAFGNRTTDSLSTTGGGGGFPWTTLALILLGILVALGAFALLKRQELEDWWNTRQYH